MSGQEREALKAAWNRVIESRGRPFPSGDAGYWFHQGFEAGYRAALAVREESTQIERSWVVRYPSGTEVRHEYERGARAASSNPETVVREECRRVTSWKGK